MLKCRGPKATAPLTFKLLGQSVTAVQLWPSLRNSERMRIFNNSWNSTQYWEKHILVTILLRDDCDAKILLTALQKCKHTDVYCHDLCCAWVHICWLLLMYPEHHFGRCHLLYHHKNGEHLSSISHVSFTALEPSLCVSLWDHHCNSELFQPCYISKCCYYSRISVGEKNYT